MFELTKDHIWDICFDTEISEEIQVKILKTKFWDDLRWDPLEVAYLQTKQKRIIVPYLEWARAIDKSVGLHKSNVLDRIIEAYKLAYETDRLYYVYVNHVASGDTEYTSTDFRFLQGMYMGKDDADVGMDFDCRVLKVLGGAGRPKQIGGVENYNTCWVLELDNNCFVYYTIYRGE